MVLGSTTPDLEKVWAGWSKIQRKVVSTRLFNGCISRYILVTSQVLRVAGNLGWVALGANHLPTGVTLRSTVFNSERPGQAKEIQAENLG